MLKLISLTIQLAFLAAVVLVLGNVVKWKGETISDQIKTQVSHAERVYDSIAGKKNLVHAAVLNRAPEKTATTSEDISTSEQQKLKALIQELNHSQTSKASK